MRRWAAGIMLAVLAAGCSSSSTTTPKACRAAMEAGDQVVTLLHDYALASAQQVGGLTTGNRADTETGGARVRELASQVRSVLDAWETRSAACRKG